MDRPLLLPFGAFALGLCLDHWLGAPAPAAAGLAALSLVAWLLLGGARRWLLPVVLAAVGLWHHAAWRIGGPHDIAVLAGPEPRLAVVRGTLLEAEPAAADPVRRDGREPWHGTLAVAAWREGRRGWEPARGTVRWRLADARGTALRGGMVVELDGVLAEPSGAALPGGFDPRAHYAVMGIHRELRLEGAREVGVLDAGPGPGWGDRFLGWAHGVLSRGLPDDEAARLIRAQALGWKPGLTRELAAPFLRAGTLHVFAISGLHIALVAMLVAQVPRLFGVGRGVCACLVVPVTWAYVAATGWQASAVRSAVMASVVAAGWALRRPSDLLNSLAAAALLILVADPSQLFQPGFQLSFAVVAGMSAWTRPVEAALSRWAAFDPLVPESHWPWWRRLLEPVRRLLVLDVASSAAAWCASLPLVVHHFQVVSPVSLVANLVVVPLSSLCLVANAAALASAPWWPGLAEWFNQSAWVWMNGMVAASRAAAAVPGGHWYAAAPAWGWWAVPAVLACTATRWASLGPRARTAWGAGLAGWAVAAAGAWAWGLGESRLVVSAGGELVWWERGFDSLLVDCGPRGFGARVAAPWLRTRGVDRLGDVVLAVPTVRFTGGWDELAAELGTGRTWAAGRARRRTATAGPSGAVPRPEPLGIGWERGPWRALWPPPDAPEPRADEGSAVLAGEVGGVRCLLVPALGEDAQRRLARQGGPALRADVVVAGVPDHGDPLVPEFLAAVRPRWVVLGCGGRSGARSLAPAARNRLRSGPWRAHFTDEDGWADLRLRSGRVRVLAGTSGQEVPVDGGGAGD